MTKYVYSFNEGNKDMRELLGGKGANLAEMKTIGLPVPDGFTITTETCNKYYIDNEKINENIINEIYSHLKKLEKNTHKHFGKVHNPLLVSVRSGSPISMPGMMDTILNLGLNDEIVEELAKTNKRFAYDSYRRLIMMFADVVKGYSKSSFERELDKYKERKNYTSDLDLNEDDMEYIANEFKKIYLNIVGEEFPQEARVQLIEAVKAVFRSWNNERARIYRKMNEIPDTLGTAVNVQEMVYGNMGDNSGTGVAFTRNPATGENKVYGEYLINAQGEDVVAGVRTPEPIDKLKSMMPDVYKEFLEVCKKLETHYKDMQDMEFTIENGKLYMLQTRNAKRTGMAFIKVAVDMVKEGLLTEEEAIMKVDPKSVDQLLHKAFDKNELNKAKVIANGLAASPGAAAGRIYFTAEDVAEAVKRKEDTILVRLETSPEDIQGMNDANGILTVRGGMTSHAAVVARGMGKCCVSGCEEITVDEVHKTLITKDGTVYSEGDYISLDGSTGAVYEGKIGTVEPEISGDFSKFMKWVDNTRTLKVMTNADTPRDTLQAIKFGAEGIGLCRTEHMFFESSRILAVRQMIVAKTTEQRKKALNKILPMQRKDFEEMFTVLNGKPFTIRYLDPPLHEFLPKEDADIRSLAKVLGITYPSLVERINELKEFNPMMGHRGCRLDITYPEIAEMQTRAVIEASINVKNKGIKVHPEIMIPLVGDIKELQFVKDIVNKTAQEVMEQKGTKVDYKVGTMIEVPRATILSDEIAKEAEFFSYGTNDLTQLTYGFSRDDASKYLNDYYTRGIFENDPFAHLDKYGVGKLIEISIEKAKKVNKDITLGICGEHGGDPSSIEFCHNAGLTYVSCSPYRVPIARLAAAQAAIKSKGQSN